MSIPRIKSGPSAVWTTCHPKASGVTLWRWKSSFVVADGRGGDLAVHDCPRERRASAGSRSSGEGCRALAAVAQIDVGHRPSGSRSAMYGRVPRVHPRVSLRVVGCRFIRRFTRGIDLFLIRGHLRNDEVSGLRAALKDDPTSIDHLCRLTAVRCSISRTRSQDRDGATTCGTCHAPTG